MSVRPRVLVTGALSPAGLAAIHELAASGFRVIGADHRPVPDLLRPRDSEPFRRLPRAEEPHYAESLGRALREVGADALLPLETASVAAVVSHERLRTTNAAVLAPPAEAFHVAADNGRALEHCRALGIPAPRSLAPDDARGPVVVKPRFDVGGARGVALCRSDAEVRRAVAACERDFGPAVVQEYVPGPADAMRAIVLLFDRQGKLRAHFTQRKVRQRPWTGGVTALALSTDDRALVSQVLPFFESLGWRGPAEVELKLDARDGRPKVIEVNPRFPGYLGFPARCGLPLATLAVRAALGCGGRGRPYLVGRRYLHGSIYLKSVLAEAWATGAPFDVVRRARRELRTGAPLPRGARRLDPGPRLAKLLLKVRDLWLALRGSARGTLPPFRTTPAERRGSSPRARAAARAPRR